ncbi:YolD-like family protein [Paenibacillus sp. 1P07SE]|uniref:YolD-like family protein n=1 Tax=Paenibacillus sp. 1P07SE TaxID=3132209 RepID=UPI0039A77034
MRKKLEGNGLWESSRMMLPEHKESNIRKRQELQRRERRELDEQELEEAGRLLHSSLEEKRILRIAMFHPYERTEVIGVVERLDAPRQRFMVDGEWFPMQDVQGVEAESLDT